MRYFKVYSFLLILFLASAVLAQPTTSSIRGTVIDDEGTPIPGALITLIGVTSSKSIVTDISGDFRFLQLPPGEYSIKVELQGFKTKMVNNIVAISGRSIETNITLQYGQIEESIVVGPPGETPTQEELDKYFSEELDAQVKRLELPEGQIMYNPPREMMEQAREMVEVKISQSLTEDLTEGLRGTGIPEVEKILVGSSMKATLAGEDFEITALSEPVQSVFSTGSTLWEWAIRPLEAGEKKLYLSIAAVFDTKYGEKMKSFPVMDRTIAVKVDPRYHRPNWRLILEITGAVVVIVGGLIGIITGIRAIAGRRRSTGGDVER